MTNKTKVKRVPKRGHYDKETIYKILDDNYHCHVGFVHEGFPVVIPTAYGRDGDYIYLHGSTASRMMIDLAAGIDMCLTVTKVNGLVLAKSGFHHSMNYESVVVFGKAELLTGKENKMHALEIITNHIIDGRWEEARLPNDKELKGTSILKLSLAEASAKIRTGMPVDTEMDWPDSVVKLMKEN